MESELQKAIEEEVVSHPLTGSDVRDRGELASLV